MITTHQPEGFNIVCAMARKKQPKTVPQSWPTASASSSTIPEASRKWQSVGFCGVCCLPLEALQPGGLNARHSGDQTPICPERHLDVMLKGDVVLDSVFEDAQAFNDRHRAVLDAADTSDRNNWEYHPPADGNKGFRIFLPTKGLK